MFKLFLFAIFFWFNLVLINPSSFAWAQSANNETELNGNWSYCFEFTWIGPKFNSYSLYNGTCQDFTDDYNIKESPCSDPLVITYNGTRPDIQYLWDHHQRSVLCQRSEGDVCAKYSYSYNGELTNATYMCTKVLSMGENKPETGSKCYKQQMRGYEVEICICQSGPGLYMPCNSASTNKWSFSIVFLTALFSLINLFELNFI